MDSGYIKLSRKFFENSLWTEPRTYSKGEAWLDLISMARFETSEIVCGNRAVEVLVGEILASNRFLQKRWQWGAGKVSSYLKLLEQLKMIEILSNQGITVLRLTNYQKYNGTQLDIPNEHNNNGLQQNEKKKRNTSGTLAERKRNTSGTLAERNKERKEREEGKERDSATTSSPALSPEFLKFQSWILENACEVSKMQEPFTQSQFESIKRDYETELICEILQSMHNWKPLRIKNKSAYLTFARWAKKEKSCAKKENSYERKPIGINKAGVTAEELADAVTAGLGRAAYNKASRESNNQG